MKVKDLSHLVEIFKLVDKDPGTKELRLDSASAHLTGMHVGATRRLPNKVRLDLEDRVINIDGSMLRGALALMGPDAALVAKQTGSSLILSAQGRRAILKTRWDKGDAEDIDFDGEVFDSTTLRREIPFLRSCVAEGVIAPILTGIRFTSVKNGVRLEASDAERRSGRLFLALPCRVQGQVVPAADFETALSLLGMKIAMRFKKGHLYVRDRRTVIKLTLLQGKYPNLSSLPKPETYQHSINFSRKRLDTAIRAATLFDSDRIITFSIENGRASLLVRGQETGGFRQPLGRCDLEDIEILFDAHWLDTAQYVGDSVRLRYNNARSSVLFSGNKRLLWMSPIVQA